MTRTLVQPPPDAPPSTRRPVPGYRIEDVLNDRARLATEQERATRICRRPGCRRRAAWALERSNGWWLYCDWHHYGRRIDACGVWSRRLTEEAIE